jgi:hypothetical protein
VSKKFLLIAMIMTFVFAMSGFAIAQDDDTAADDDDDSAPADPFHLEGLANGEYPVVLEAEMQYEFAFDVFNDAGGDVKIKNVAITLPNTSYAMDDFEAEMDGVTEDYTWKAVYDEETATITWEAFGATSSVEMGDIAEGEMLTFSFLATTDADATDGFAWTITGDNDGDTSATDVFFFGGEPGDDDDTVPTDDDDDTVDGDDDDDDDSGGCGC